MNLIHVLKNILFYPLVDPVILPNHLLLPHLHYPFVDCLVSIASPCMIFFSLSMSLLTLHSSILPCWWYLALPLVRLTLYWERVPTIMLTNISFIFNTTFS